ncbi:HD domain-containing protein [Microbulbifer taiwanensis]|uniref:HD domain-containing protein n=1 Tax=Microbulbifer taiwanensis TaxID=986746 RepID=A0ABW1YJU5_9GAMM|nr:HD domain-containing protein [Microbulbifer taiwanensis]
MNRSSEPLAAIEQLFLAHGDRQLGEHCSQLQHASQCAALAEREGCSDALICAAFLHDIGHLYAMENRLPGCDDRGHSEHDRIGAELLQRWGFPQSVTAPIALHVEAKRFLVAADRNYGAQLSDASRHSLVLQGTAMRWEEQQEFLGKPYARQSLALRRWDDTGKAEGLNPQNLKHWLDCCARVLETSELYAVKH